MVRRQLLYLLGAVTVGLLAGIAVLLVNPQAGRTVGDRLYSSRMDPRSYHYAVSKAAPSVVNIYVTKINGNYADLTQEAADLTTSASGVIMTADGYLVTNYHVIPSENTPDHAVWAQTRNGTVYPAFIVGCDRRTDIAVLKIEAGGLPPIPINTRYEPEVGDVVLAIGNPNNLGQTVTHGIISATSRSGSGLLTRGQMNIRQGLQDLIQTDAPINSGNSGGALINTAGALVGINTASFNGLSTYGIGFCVPFKLVRQVMQDIIAHGRVIRGYLGISDDGIALLPDGQTVAVKVGYVDPAGPAFGVLHLNDLILAVNGTPLTSLRGLIDAVSGSKPGSVLTFKIMRGTETREERITLTEDRTSVD